MDYLQNELRSFFSYIKDSIKINETKNQWIIRILFLVIFTVSLLFSYFILKVLENPDFQKAVEEGTKLISEENAMNLFRGDYSRFSNIFKTIVPYLLIVSSIQLFLSLFISLIMIVYMRQLVNHHITTNNSQRISPIIFKSFLLQLLMFPVLVISMIDMTATLPLLVYTFFNSIYIFTVFNMLEGENNFTRSLSKAFELYKTRFFRVFFLILLFQIFSGLILNNIPSLFNSLYRPMITRAVYDYLHSLIIFFEIRFLFFLYKDLKHPVAKP